MLFLKMFWFCCQFVMIRMSSDYVLALLCTCRPEHTHTHTCSQTHHIYFYINYILNAVDLVVSINILEIWQTVTITPSNNCLMSINPYRLIIETKSFISQMLPSKALYIYQWMCVVSSCMTDVISVLKRIIAHITVIILMIINGDFPSQLMW